MELWTFCIGYITLQSRLKSRVFYWKTQKKECRTDIPKVRPTKKQVLSKIDPAGFTFHDDSLFQLFHRSQIDREFGHF